MSEWFPSVKQAEQKGSESGEGLGRWRLATRLMACVPSLEPCGAGRKLTTAGCPLISTLALLHKMNKQTNKPTMWKMPNQTDISVWTQHLSFLGKIVPSLTSLDCHSLYGPSVKVWNSCLKFNRRELEYHFCSLIQIINIIARHGLFLSLCVFICKRGKLLSFT